MAIPILALLPVVKQILAKVLPDKKQREEAELNLLKLQQAGDFRGIELQLSAIVMEAKSQDPWTSRARPSFLYVMYIMILMSIPMGILNIFQPEMATAIAAGMKEWLNAIPGEMWALFGAGYLGYVVKRSGDKKNLLDSMVTMGLQK